MDGGVAQLGEHLPCKQGVMGSNPIISTTGQCPDPMIGVESAMRVFSPRESRSDERRKEQWAEPGPNIGGSECYAVLQSPRIPFRRKPGREREDGEA